MRRRLGRARRIAVVLAWSAIPALALAAAGAYVGAALVWHVNPPVVPVEGQSMAPVLRTGDLVLLHGVNPATVKVGEIVAVAVPSEDRSKYGLPAEVVHRVVRVTRTRQGLVFQTKGDANAGPDVFLTPASDLIGRETGVVPDAGYLLLFFRSRQGEIFLGAVLLVALVYVLLAWLEQRSAENPTPRLLEALLEETERVRAELAGPAAGADPGDGASEAGEPALGAAGTPVPARTTSVAGTLAELAAAVGESTRRSDEIERSLAELVEAVREYAGHLRSHTAAVQALALAAEHLEAMAAELRSAAGGAPAGWYPDFTGEPQLRYFDGERWTGHVAPMTPSA
ncbi:MAG TPA: signal peptidase I [Acidimicrobiales bacterium]|nr:signal peptidase I [Acidimicrobiales bacterium]